ncbi:MAG: efflux RND transporter periplasmic adaptor subunit [Pseudomonadales bacterium]|jgi:multidrug efflux pump subunit AcrA (membrane-fusion protein)|nr:efflux RND transporter periplasmic adaptor subunit [Pseudomonadales bacterium]
MKKTVKQTKQVKKNKDNKKIKQAKKLTKKQLSAIGIGVATAIFIASIITAAVIISNNNRPPIAQVVIPQKQNLEATIDVIGTIYSSTSTEIYSTLQFAVDEVNVRVGDEVSEGDILARLDTSLLASELAQRRALLSLAEENARHNLEAAEQNLERTEYNIEHNRDAVISSAEAMLTSAEQVLRSAETELRIARENLQNFIDVHGADENNPDYIALRDIVSRAETARNGSRANRDRARDSLYAARAAQDQNIAGQQNIVAGARLAQNFDDQRIVIQRLERELGRGVIRSPVSGTVTAVNVVAGSPSLGSLFVIQDTDNLIVRTNITELDIAAISLGDQVNIRAGGISDQIFTGTITKIAPTSTAATTGTTLSPITSEFEVEIAINPNQNGLRVGMSARISIVSQRKENALAVPIEAITVNENGEQIVFITTTREGRGYAVEAVRIITGIRTNNFVEISAESLPNNAQVIRNASGMRSGAVVTPR